VLVALWICYCSLRTFSDLALVFFVISLLSFCLQMCWTEEASMTRNRFLIKANCDQIRLRHPCGVLMLNCLHYRIFRNGWTKTGTFFAVASILDRMRTKQRVDVLRTVKDLRDMRPHMVDNQVSICVQDFFLPWVHMCKTSPVSRSPQKAKPDQREILRPRPTN